MARYRFHWFSSPRLSRGLNRIYIISALLVVALVVVFIYGWHLSNKPVPSPSTSLRVNSAEGNEDQPIRSLPEPKAVTAYVNERSEAPIVEALPQAEAVTTEKPIAIQPVQPLAAEAKRQHDLTGRQPSPSTESDPKVTEIIAEAMALVNEKPSRVIEARDRLNDALLMPMSTKQRALVEDQLSKLAEQWLFSKSLFPNDKLCGSYKVQPSDQLRIIGQQYKVPYEILMQINNIRRPEALQVGQIIKVVNGPFHAKVCRSTFTMDLYLQNTFVRSFPVGLGQPGMETPTGLWRVKLNGKLVKPIWTNPLTGRTYHPEDPDYPLGSRWIALEGLEGPAKDRAGFAIHGTKEPDQIGTAGSQGCIRLHNGDAILLYNVLVPIHSLVRVEE